MLEFVRKLFLHVSPNVTALSKTIEDCLLSLGYKLDTAVGFAYVELSLLIDLQDALQHHFSNSLNWYISLRHAMDELVHKLLQNACASTLNDPSPELPTNGVSQGAAAGTNSKKRGQTLLEQSEAEGQQENEGSRKR